MLEVKVKARTMIYVNAISSFDVYSSHLLFFLIANYGIKPFLHELASATPLALFAFLKVSLGISNSNFVVSTLDLGGTPGGSSIVFINN